MAAGSPSILNLRLNSRPEVAGLVRAVVGGLAGPLALQPDVLGDVKIAVSEACNNAVDHAYRGQSGVVAVHLDVHPESIEATVRDWGGGFRHVAPVGDHLRVGLPLINALASRVEFLTAPGSGTEVRMGFDLPHDRRRDELLCRLAESEDLEAWTPWRRGLFGDVVVTLLPRELLPGVLEPLTSALAAESRFSLECFSDVYLLVRAVIQEVQAAATSRRLSFSLTVREGRLELTVGPLEAGTGERLAAQRSGRPDAGVAALADELEFEALEQSELLRIALSDREHDSRPAEESHSRGPS